MSVLRAIRAFRIPAAAVILSAAGAIGQIAAQVGDVSTLDGEWVRLDSSNRPNDRMRIRIEQGAATVLYLPTGSSSAYRIGMTLWTGIQADGSARIRGSDQNFYPSRLRLEGDFIHVRIDHSGTGSVQRWGRPGPDIEGEWVRVAIGNRPGDRMRIRINANEASVRYLPAEANRNLRVGSLVWRSISTGGTVEVLGSNGRYQATDFVLEEEGRVIRIPGARPGEDEVWVRPGDIDLRGWTNQTPVAQGPPACVSTSVRANPASRFPQWRIGIPSDRRPVAQSIGVLEYLGTASTSAGATVNFPPTTTVVDIESSRFPGIPESFTYVIEQGSGGIGSEVRTDLTATAFNSENNAQRAAGRRAIDIEVYTTDAGVRYAGVWAPNDERVSWSVHHGLTGDEFGELFQDRREAGYRLIDVEAYTTSPGGETIRYAAIWYRSCDNDNWLQNRGMTRESYQNLVDERSARGFRVVDFESYMTSAGQRYAAIWERLPGQWVVRTDRNLNWFLNYHREYTDAGYRLLDYEAYEGEDGGTLYAGVWMGHEPRLRLAMRPGLDSAVQNYRDLHRIPGISVAILRGGDLIYSRGFGWADSARSKQAYSGTVYEVASIAKAVAGTLAARLEQRGVIDLTDALSEVLDDVPVGVANIQLDHVLAKIGCIWHYPEGPEPTESRYDSQIDALKQIWGAPPLAGCTPGDEYHYSTHGYTFVGAALEKATGKSLTSLIRDELMGPMGLTTLRPTEATADSGSHRRNYHTAEPYRFSQGKNVLTRYDDSSWKILGGGLQTDVVDLAKFGWYTLNGGPGGGYRWITQATRDNRLWDPLTTGVVYWSDSTRAAPRTGLGWEVGTDGNSRRFAEHGGSAKGARSHLRVYRDDDIVIAVLTNQREDGNPAVQVPGGEPPVHFPETLVNTLARIVFANP